MPLIKRKQRLLYACVLWAVLLVVLAMEPDKLVEACLPLSILRSLAHSAAYGTFAFLLTLYFSFRRRFFGRLMNGRTIYITAFILTAIFGGFTEIIQLFSPDRYAELMDWYFDIAGAGAGIYAFILLRRWQLL